MGWIKVLIPDEIEDNFRKIAMEKFGYKRGSISNAIEESIRDFIKKNK